MIINLKGWSVVVDQQWKDVKSEDVDDVKVQIWRDGHDNAEKDKAKVIYHRKWELRPAV